MTLPALDDYRWLVSPQAAEAIAEARATAPQGAVALAARLRQTLSCERAALAIEQAELRRRAAAKFGAADGMFFTARGLEQSTDERVAAHKARRFPLGGRVVDLCCGIGGDLLALVERGPTLAVDRDPVVVTLAGANLAGRRASRGGQGAAADDEDPAPRPSPAELDESFPARVIVDEVHPRLVAEADAWHIDPDRRVGARRTTRIELGEPGVETIDALLAAGPNGAVKLAPAAQPPAAWSERAEWEWISRRGECRQLVAWFGSLAETPGRRRATVFNVDPTAPDGFATTCLVGEGGVIAPVAERIGRYVYEPDAAVLAADLGGNLAVQRELASIVPGGAYLTGERAVEDPLLAAFAVEEVMPFDLRRVKAALLMRRIGRIEVKQRGTDLDPADVRRRLRVKGEEQATLLLARIGKSVAAILAHRLR